MSSATEFYDLLSSDYHMIATGWEDAVRKQGEILNTLLRNKLQISRPAKILDCTCGIGTQALGLALHGHEVIGTDISPKSIEIAKENSKRLRIAAHFEVANMMELSKFENQFDIVLSFDNAIAHVLEDSQLVTVFESMKATLRSGGSLLISARDYDLLASERPTGMVPRRIKDRFGDRVYAQTWEWTDDSKYYDMNLFVLKNLGEKWESRPLATRMRAYKKLEIEGALGSAGLNDLTWILPQESSYYQPIVWGRD